MPTFICAAQDKREIDKLSWQRANIKDRSLYYLKGYQFLLFIWEFNLIRWEIQIKWQTWRVFPSYALRNIYQLRGKFLWIVSKEDKKCREWGGMQNLLSNQCCQVARYSFAILYTIYIYSKCLSIVLAETEREGDEGALRFQSVLWPHVLYNYRG